MMLAGMKIESIKCDMCGTHHETGAETYATIYGTILIGDSTQIGKDMDDPEHYCIGCLKDKLTIIRVRGVECIATVSHNEDGPTKTVDNPLGTMICGGDSGIPSNPNPPPPPPKWPEGRLFKEDGFGGSKEITGQERRDLGL